MKSVPPSVFINKDYQVRQALADLILTGVFERFPRLRVGSVEHELAWIPFFLDQMDYTYTDRPRRGEWYRFAEAGVLPSDYWHRNCFASFQEDGNGVRMRDVIGVETLMWGSDYPHTGVDVPALQGDRRRDPGRRVPRRGEGDRVRQRRPPVRLPGTG